MKKNILELFSKVIFIFSILCGSYSYAEEVGPDVQPTSDDINAMQYISCETGYLSDVSNYGSPHTCIETPLLNNAVLAILTLGQSVLYTVRMKMHQDQLYPDNCTRAHRADYWDPRISFGMCNNIKLIAANIGQLFLAIGGASPIPKLEDYTIRYDNRKPGDVDGYADLSFFPPFPVLMMAHTAIDQDQICVNVLSFGGFLPLGCKYIKEPFPKSIFEVYASGDPSKSSPEQCSSTYNCSEKAKLKSKTLTPVLSPIISCVREMILRLIISTKVCDPNKIDQNTSENLAKAFALGLDNGSMVNKFQRNMQNLVSGLLTIYVIIFGFKVATGGSRMKPKDMINFVIKFLLVTYFSVGINMTSGGSVQRFDGMTQLIFPLLLNGVTEVAGWMMAASSMNGLCSFPSSIYSSNADISMSLWDQIDCRLAYYIGYDGLVESMMTKGDDPVSHSIPPYVFFMLPGLIMGNVQLIMMALMYPIMIVSFVAYSLCMFVSALVLIVIVGILAPIFVPLALFDFTKEYFNKWWKILLTLLIQPAIAITFMSIMFSVYDRAFYGTCVYRSVNVNVRDQGDIKQYRTFYISTDSRDYAGQEEVSSCTGSLGYFLNNPINSLFGSVDNASLNSMGELKGSIDINPQDPELKKRLPNKDGDYLKGEESPKLQWTKGLFTQSPKMFWEDLVNMIKNLILCFIMLTVLKNLMNSINQFIMSLAGEQISAAGQFDPGQIQKIATDKAGQAAGSAANAINKLKGKLKGKLGGKSSGGDGDSVGGVGGGK
jgi:type IV secretion system protein VirB6